MNNKFKYYCWNNELKKAQELYASENIDIHYREDYYFRTACMLSKDINLIKWLYSLGNINIHAKYDDAFRGACQIGRFETCQWLYSLGNIDIHAIDDCAFKLSCSNATDNVNYCYRVVKWLLSIDRFDNNLVDKYLPWFLYEYAIELGYAGENIKNSYAYQKYQERKAEIKKQIKVKNIDGEITLFEFDELVNIIVSYA